MAVSKFDSIERERGKPMRKILLEEYEKHGSQIAVAKALGVSQPTLSLWLKALQLEERKILVPREVQ